MMGKKYLYISLVLFAFFLASCGELIEDLGPEEPQNPILIKSLEDGYVITPDYPITFEILPVAETEPDTNTPLPDETGSEVPEAAAPNEASATDALELAVNLYHGSELFLNSREPLPEPFTEETLTLPDSIRSEMPEGLYRLEFIVYRGEQQLADKAINFFYVMEEYAIKSIESFPPVVYPNITVDLRAQLQLPPLANPFLRWEANSLYLNSGLLQDGWDSIRWKAPEEEGIYSINLELFPVAPPNEVSYPFASSLNMKIDLFVSKANPPSFHNLLPAQSYFLLFHFAGDYLGTRQQEDAELENLSAAPLGTPLFVIHGDDLALQLFTNSGLQIPGPLFPVKNGGLQPFTLSLGLEKSPTQQGSQIITFQSADGTIAFSLGLDQNEQYTAELRLQDETLSIPSPIQAVAERKLISLSIQPEGEQLTAVWFQDGLPLIQHTFPEVPNSGLGSSGKTTLGGGEAGFSGYLDELGIYYRDSENRPATNPNLYSDALKLEYPEDFIYADGFDGMYLSSHYTLSGTYRLENSQLQLSGEDAGLSLPPVQLGADPLRFTSQLSGPPASGLQLLLDGTAVLSLTLQGEIFKADLPAGNFQPAEELLFTIDSQKQELRLGADETQRPLPLPELAGAELLTLRYFTADEAPLYIDSLLLIRQPRKELTAAQNHSEKIDQPS